MYSSAINTMIRNLSGVARNGVGVLKLDMTQQQLTAFYEKLQLEFRTFNIRSRASRIVLFFAGTRELYDMSEFLRNFTLSRRGCALCEWTSERKATKDTHRGREWKKVEAFAQTSANIARFLRFPRFLLLPVSVGP